MRTIFSAEYNGNHTHTPMDTSTLLSLSNDALTYAVLAFFIIWPFKQVLRYSMPATCVVTLMFGVYSCWFFNLFYGPYTTVSPYVNAGMMLWFFLALASLRLCIQQSVFHLLFLLCLVVHTCSNLSAVALYLVKLVPMDFSFLAALLVAKAILLIICMPFFWFLMVFLYPKVLEADIKRSYWFLLWMIPACLYIVFASKFVHHYQEAALVLQWEEFFFLMLWNLCTYLTFSVILIMLIKTDNYDKASAHALLVDKQLGMQKAQYAKLVQYIHSTDKLRHDWRQHIHTLSALAEAEQFEEMKQYLLAYNTGHAIEDISPICQNIAVDALLRHYKSTTKEKGVAFTIQADVPAHLPVPNVDLCLVLGNVLENALEACLAMDAHKKAERFMRLKIRPMHNQLLISLENSYSGELKMHKNAYLSTKHQGAGLGIGSARHVAERYGGFLDIKTENHVFHVRVSVSLLTV